MLAWDCVKSLVMGGFDQNNQVLRYDGFDEEVILECGPERVTFNFPLKLRDGNSEGNFN